MKFNIITSLKEGADGWAVNGRQNDENIGYFFIRKSLAVNPGDKFQFKMAFEWNNLFITDFTLTSMTKMPPQKTLVSRVKNMQKYKEDLMQTYIDDIGKEVDFYLPKGEKIKATIFDANLKGVRLKIGEKLLTFILGSPKKPSRKIFALSKEEITARSERVPNGLVSYHLLKKDTEALKEIMANHSHPLSKLIRAGFKSLPNKTSKGLKGRYIEFWQDNDHKGTPSWRVQVKTDSATPQTIGRRFFRSNDLYPRNSGVAPRLVSLFDLKSDKPIKDIAISNVSGETNCKTIIIRNSKGEIVWQRVNSLKTINSKTKSVQLDPKDRTYSKINYLLQRPIKLGPNVKANFMGIQDGIWSSAAPHLFYSSSRNLPQSVDIDMGTVRKINALRFARNNNGKAQEIEFSVSTDGSKFTPVGSKLFEQSPSKNKKFTLHIGEQQARWVRVTFKSSFNSMPIGLVELEAYRF